MAKVGDFVRVIGENIEGVVYKTNSQYLVVQNFLGKQLNGQNGPDVKATIVQHSRVKSSDIKIIGMEDIHKAKYSPYFSMDQTWLKLKYEVPPKLVNSYTEVFWPKNEFQEPIRNENGITTINSKVSLEEMKKIYFDESNWSRAEDYDYLSQDVVYFEMADGDHEYFLCTDSWRIRSNFLEYILKATTTQKITNIETRFAKMRKSYNHKCSPECMTEIVRHQRANFSREFKDNMFFEIPFKYGFERSVETIETTEKKESFVVTYTAPCGKTVKNNRELEQYFIKVEMNPADLGYINFDFQNKKLLNKLTVCKEGEQIVYPDLSGGRENIKIPVVSSIKCRPPKILYPKTKNLPIPKYLDEDEYQKFMICCSCTDGCQPKTCECMQLTYEGFRSTSDFFQKGRGARSDLKNGLITQERYDEILSQMQTNCGYHDGIIQTNQQQQENKKGSRKNALTTSGVYECHSGCVCHNKWCNNRVVQNGMKIPLVIYRTPLSGWGIRTIVDLKAGYYLGDYFGEILFEMTCVPWDKAKFYESTTAAKLNFIENAEAEKHLADINRDADDGFGDETHERFSSTRIMLHESQGPVMPPAHSRYNKLNEASRRTLMPIIDASKTGNLGRFFNHSCSPNIGIQNVFTNHHDIRYPHTSFFTLRNIKAGEELCWHYGYVNTGTQECYCGTKACNGFFA